MNDKVKKLLEDINKKFGKDIIFTLEERRQEFVPHISTGILRVDKALGVGGFPLGRIVEIFGAEATGKSSLCLSAAAQAQKNNMLVAYIDTEHALDTFQAEKLGVNVDAMLISQPENAEEVFELIEAYLDLNQVSLIIVDSVNAMLTEREWEADIGDAVIGIKAKLMNQALPRIRPKVHKSSTCVVFLNQIRSVIGAIGHAPTTTTSGGYALKFYSDVRGEIKRIGQLKSDKSDDPVGHKNSIRFVKNRCNIPFKTGVYEIYYDDFHTIYAELLSLGVELEIIKKGGAWYTYKDSKFNGREKFCQALIENESLKNELEIQIRQLLGL